MGEFFFLFFYNIIVVTNITSSSKWGVGILCSFHKWILVGKPEVIKWDYIVATCEFLWVSLLKWCGMICDEESVVMCKAVKGNLMHIQAPNKESLSVSLCCVLYISTSMQEVLFMYNLINTIITYQSRG